MQESGSEVQAPSRLAAWEAKRAHAESRIAWTVWYVYGAFYFCRTNLSAAVPGLSQPLESGGLGFNEQQIGIILAALKITYAVGQLINGQLAERFSPRILLAIGMLGSAALNVAFGFGTSLYFLIFVWAANGYCQSLGWTPSVRVIANWTPVAHRGRVLGFIGTGYQLAGVLTFVVAGQAARHFGWQGALWVPAGILTAAALAMLIWLKDAPDEQARADSGSIASNSTRKHAFGETIWMTLSNPALWILGVSLALLDACRYGYVDWGLKHLSDVQGSRVDLAALKYSVLPAGGIAGALAAGWATDRIFGSRRAPVICLLLVVLGVATLGYDRVAHASVPATVALLVLIGFCLMGPQVLLVGTAPADLARHGTAAAAAGFVNSMAYAGAAVGDVSTGWVLKNYGWQTTILMWAGWAFGAAAVAGLLWNVKASTPNSTDSKDD